MGFAENLNKLCKRAKDKAHVVVRKTAFELQGMMIDTSPVRTGRFRSNWAVGLGAINTSADAAPDKTGDSAKGRAQAALQGWQPVQWMRPLARISGPTAGYSSSFAYFPFLFEGRVTT